MRRMHRSMTTLAARRLATTLVCVGSAFAQQNEPKPASPAPVAANATAPAAKADAPPGMQWIAGGRYWMGSQTQDVDAPLHEVQLTGFWLDETEVTNAQFAAFVAAVHYVTDAEKKPSVEDVPGLTDEQRVAGSLVFVPPPAAVDLRQFWRWWQFVPGADWRHPQGPQSNIAGLDDHPVVQVSWRDAQAYAKWAQKRLPTEAEWEYAARGGLDRKPYVWGDAQVPEGKWRCNIWQGVFPSKNDLADGYAATAPVRTFAQNGYGLYGMSGNVWEWCQDHYRPDGYGDPHRLAIDPQGPAASFDPAEPGIEKRVMRGGSFLCSDVYCLGYLPGTRMKSSPDTALCHTGFRCAKSK